jgi:hypothetical protein
LVLLDCPIPLLFFFFLLSFPRRRQQGSVKKQKEVNNDKWKKATRIYLFIYLFIYLTVLVIYAGTHTSPKSILKKKKKKIYKKTADQLIKMKLK